MKKGWVNTYVKIKVSYVKQSFIDQNKLYKAYNVGQDLKNKKQLKDKWLKKCLGLINRSRIILIKRLKRGDPAPKLGDEAILLQYKMSF